MAQSEKVTPKTARKLMNPLQLENAFLMFAIIYVPVSILFLGRGVVAEALLIMYTFLLSLAILLLLVRFVIFLAKAANEHNGQFGSVLIMYFLNMFLPLLTAKYVAYTVWKMLPCTCYRYGLFADAVRGLKDMYVLFNLQHNLTWLVVGSLVMVAVFAFWSINKKQS